MVFVAALTAMGLVIALLLGDERLVLAQGVVLLALIWLILSMS